ncbi:MAG: homocysteine S-methyltransferase family protein [Candidatus Hodarchaeales archaeon]|jgi:methionine synthase I (cobalamin-dependent)
MSFTNWLEDDSKVILFDGGMGSELIKRGHDPGKVLDLLNVKQPTAIEEIHASYYQAGSDMVQTCTFSSNLVNLEKHGLEDRIEEINKQALENIKAACPQGRIIVGDVGPSGEFRPPVGKATGEEWEAGFRKQVEVLEPGVELWHVETMSDIKEMLAGIRTVKKISNKPVIASMTYRSSKRGYFTIMGDPLEDCIGTLENEKVDVIGANCTLASNEMIELAEKLVDLTKLPVSIKPNAGQPRLEGGKTSYDQTPYEFVKDMEKMIQSGVKIVGGCCGTSPTHVKLLRDLINNL